MNDSVRRCDKSNTLIFARFEVHLSDNVSAREFFRKVRKLCSRYGGRFGVFSCGHVICLVLSFPNIFIILNFRVDYGTIIRQRIEEFTMAIFERSVLDTVLNAESNSGTFAISSISYAVAELLNGDPMYACVDNNCYNFVMKHRKIRNFVSIEPVKFEKVDKNIVRVRVLVKYCEPIIGGATGHALVLYDLVDPEANAETSRLLNMIVKELGLTLTLSLVRSM